MDLYTLVGEIVIFASVMALGLFIYYYGRYSPWTSTWQGRILMAQKIAMLALLTHAGFATFLDYPGEGIVRLALFAILPILFWLMFAALRFSQREQSSTTEGEQNAEPRIHPGRDDSGS